ncbi:hypothetical protein DB88DRAFT_486686 [Papiliotrema laurentii]|uniref:Uncharacterized protein n=1 Tax=Papiliotrema laurentii TaxID=5418 RepID=A0AAD9FRB7_PAPLA|nr:hypothetical protein DB88DRAFT_486686 [Papiliotrema laurentii]
MASLNPSHNVFRHPHGRHAQAVHDPQSSTSHPDDVSDSGSDIGIDARSHAEKKARKEGRKRVRQAVPPMPDLRFEQSYLLSIRPYLTPAPSASKVNEKGGNVDEEDQKTRSLVLSAEDDAVYKWGRDVQVNWSMVVYVTLRDQVLSPLIQGALWGWGTVLLASTSYALRSALYPPSHVPQGRMTGGPGGKISEAGGGEAVGATGWWRNFVKSWGGAVETAAV